MSREPLGNPGPRNVAWCPSHRLPHSYQTKSRRRYYAVRFAGAYRRIPVCKANDLDNLYVVDGSFLVSSAAVNPTLTIIANALRVGEHLAGRLGGSVLARPPAQVEPDLQRSARELVLAK